MGQDFFPQESFGAKDINVLGWDFFVQLNDASLFQLKQALWLTFLSYCDLKKDYSLSCLWGEPTVI